MRAVSLEARIPNLEKHTYDIGQVIPAIVAELASEFEGMKLKVRMPNIARPIQDHKDELPVATP